jgi:hypothetical protein
MVGTRQYEPSNQLIQSSRFTNTSRFDAKQLSLVYKQSRMRRIFSVQAKDMTMGVGDVSRAQ